MLNEEPRLRIGDFDVLSSGVVLIPRSQPIDFEFMFDPSAPNREPMILRIVFEKDPTTESGRYSEKTRSDVFEGESKRGKFQGLRLVNFLPALGRGSKGPLEVGTFNGRKLLFSFWSTPLGKTTIQLQYTFLLGREVGNG